MKKRRYAASAARTAGAARTGQPVSQAASKPDLVERLRSFVSSIRLMALHPDRAAQIEMEREGIGFKSGARQMLPTFAVLLLFVGTLTLLAPPLREAAADGSIIEIPKPVAFVLVGALACLGWVLMAVIGMALVHLLAVLAGGHGEMKKLFHLITRFMVAMSVAWVLMSAVDMFLPAISVGENAYPIGRLLLDLYFVYAVAKMTPPVYGISARRGWLVGAGFWLASMLIGYAGTMAQASAQAGAA